MSHVTSYSPFPAAHEPTGHVARWATWDGDGEETTTILWENEGFTVSGQVSRENVQYVLRLSPTWRNQICGWRPTAAAAGAR